MKKLFSTAKVVDSFSLSKRENASRRFSDLKFFSYRHHKIRVCGCASKQSLITKSRRREKVHQREKVVDNIWSHMYTAY